jgi:hypothetical protein
MCWRRNDSYRPHPTEKIERRENDEFSREGRAEEKGSLKKNGVFHTSSKFPLFLIASSRASI